MLQTLFKIDVFYNKIVHTRTADFKRMYQNTVLIIATTSKINTGGTSVLLDELSKRIINSLQIKGTLMTQE